MNNIWILNHYAVPPGYGAGTRHYDFSLELIRRGYDVTIFASSFNHFSKKEILDSNKLFKEENINGVKFVWLKTWPKYKDNGIKRFLNMFSYFINVIKIYRRFRAPDIVIGSSVHLFACLAASYISGKTGAKFICEIRDLWPQTLIDMGAISSYHPIAIFFKLIEKYLYSKKAHKIIVLLPNAYEYIKGFKVDNEKVVYIPNGVDTKKFDDCLNNKTMLNIMDKTTFNCVYTGAHGLANNLENIINAAKLISDKCINNIKFYLIGDGSEKNRLIEYSKKLNLNNVFFLDPVDKAYIPSLLKSSDIQIFNLKKADVFKYGISSNKLFDYMCSGKPIVFACECSNDIVKELNAGISVPPEEPAALADAIVKLYKMSEEERNTLGANGRKYIEENHCIPYLVDKLESCFK